MNILEDKDTCINCGKEVMPWYKVCSNRCAGALGGKKGTTGGFAAGDEGRERARVYGRIGGLKSRRGKANA